MALDGLSEKQLSNALFELIVELHRQGKLPGIASFEEAKKLASEVSHQLATQNDLTVYKQDLHNDNFKNALATACIAQHSMNKNPGFQFDYTLLFKYQNEGNKIKLTAELSKLFLLQMEKASNGPIPKLTLENMKKHAALMAEKLVEKNARTENNFFIFETPKVMGLLAAALDLLTHTLKPEKNVIAEELKAQRVALYNIDTNMPGSIAGPVLGNPFGNIAGALDQEPLPTYSFAGEQNKVDFGVPDPLGIMFATILNAIASNADNPDYGVEQDMRDANLLGNNSPQLKPPGSIPT